MPVHCLVIEESNKTSKQGQRIGFEIGTQANKTPTTNPQFTNIDYFTLNRFSSLHMD